MHIKLHKFMIHTNIKKYKTLPPQNGPKFATIGTIKQHKNSKTSYFLQFNSKCQQQITNIQLLRTYANTQILTENVMLFTSKYNKFENQDIFRHIEGAFCVTTLSRKKFEKQRKQLTIQINNAMNDFVVLTEISILKKEASCQQQILTKSLHTHSKMKNILRIILKIKETCNDTNLLQQPKKGNNLYRPHNLQCQFFTRKLTQLYRNVKQQ
eukprot:TRINITY_DN5015_c0_g1_i1.p2 TRINITY_DN5015_c0_g1~~TRINITY_DN5015_c0_g1_i1.p2  ORF type:complete len:211 (+),score=-8.10 TRINITY_DN5015_c0_g1_i1:399-1031(+)